MVDRMCLFLYFEFNMSSGARKLFFILPYLVLRFFLSCWYLVITRIAITFLIPRL